MATPLGDLTGSADQEVARRGDPWRLHACVWPVQWHGQASPHTVFEQIDFFDGGLTIDFSYVNPHVYVFRF